VIYKNRIGMRTPNIYAQDHGHTSSAWGLYNDKIVLTR